MKIIKIAFNEKCPHCSHLNKIPINNKWLVCENCGGGWESSLHGGRYEEPRIFLDSPVPQGYDRRIRN